MKRQLSGLEYMLSLLLVQFLTPISGGSQAPEIPVPGDPTCLLVSTGTSIPVYGHIHSNIHTYQMKS